MRSTTLALSILLLAFGADAFAKSAAEYDLKVTPAKAPKGSPTDFAITISPKEGWVLTTETPFKIKLKSPESIALTKAELSSKDFKDPKSAAKSVGTTFTAASSGKHQIEADMMFFLCTKEICKRFTAQHAQSIVVN